MVRSGGNPSCAIIVTPAMILCLGICFCICGLQGCGDTSRPQWEGHYAASNSDYSMCYTTKPNPTTICQANVSYDGMCLRNWHSAGEHCFHVLEDRSLSFFKALAACKSLNATLPTPKSTTAHEKVQQLCGTQNPMGCWLGLVEGCAEGQLADGPDGVWTWLDCTSDNIEGRWVSGEPNNFKEDQKVAVINRDTKLVFCGAPRHW